MATPNKKLVLALISIFVTEALIMAVIDYYNLSEFVETMADAIVLVLIAQPILYLIFVRPMIAQNAEKLELVQKSQAQLKAFTHQIVEAQERERQLIATELSENVVQTIASCLMKVQTLEYTNDQVGTVASGLNGIDQEMQLTYGKLLEMSRSLHPLILDTQGFNAAIQHDLNKLRDKYHIQINFHERVKLSHLPNQMEVILYRIVQEALSNVVEHAKATQVSVYIEQEKNLFNLSIEDDGIGFMPEKLDPYTCLGIIGMQERASMIGGTLSIKSNVGKGTFIDVTVPISEPN